MKDKLVKLILEAPRTPCVIGGQASGRNFQTAENIADYLIANGATIPVYCKNCRFCEKHYPEKRLDQEATPEWYCTVYKRYRSPDDFCSCGKRKTQDVQ